MLGTLLPPFAAFWSQEILHAFPLSGFPRENGFYRICLSKGVKIDLDVPSYFLMSLREILALYSSMAALFVSVWKSFRDC